MTVIGRVDSLWRYPVKSMRGEELAEAYVRLRRHLRRSPLRHPQCRRTGGLSLPHRARASRSCCCPPRFRFPDKAARPPNQAEAEALGPGVTTVYGDAQDLALDVELPSGEVLAIDDPALLRTLGERSQRPGRLTLLRSDRALTDCRPLSLFSLQTAPQLAREVGRRRRQAALSGEPLP